MVQPRRYSGEQIHFVLSRIVRNIKNADIITQYNKHYAEVGGHITGKQLKYVRLTYGTDPAFG